MKIPSLVVSAAMFAAIVLTAGAGKATAQTDLLPGPVLECLQDCRGLRRTCLQGCNAAVRDCLSGPRVEMRICRYMCSTEFEADSPELEACVEGCRESILEPALAECRPLRRECAAECLPGPCLRICRPDGPGLDEIDACIGGCATDLRHCARSNHVALHECLQPCREIVDTAEALACAGECADAAVEAAGACLEEYSGCTTGCEPSPTTTLP